MTIPPELLKAADLLPYEAISVWNVTRGTRFETYAISGLPDSTDVCVNGAAAHLVSPKDIVIIASFVEVPESEVREHKPLLVFVDANNRLKPSRAEVAGPQVLKV